MAVEIPANIVNSQSPLCSQAALAFVFSWLNFLRVAEVPEQTKLTGKPDMLGDADDAYNAAGGYMGDY